MSNPILNSQRYLQEIEDSDTCVRVLYAEERIWMVGKQRDHMAGVTCKLESLLLYRVHQPENA